MKKYKLIAIDIDGTLLNNDKKILDETKNDIIKSYKNGCHIVIATGRSYVAAKQYFEQFTFNIPLILFNGASIKMSKEDREIYNKTLSNELAIKIYNLVNENLGTCCFWIGDKVYFNKENDYSFYYEKLTSIKPEIIYGDFNLENVNKFIWFDKPNNLTKIQNDLLSQIAGINYFKSQTEMLEIVPIGVSKGIALEYLANLLNINNFEVIAIGDDENDISMIRYAGLGVAMENAKDIVKKEADYITESNEKNGVGKVINKFIF